MTQKEKNVEINQETIERKVVESAAEQIVASVLSGHDLMSRIQEQVESQIRIHCDDTVSPLISEEICKFVIQQTNNFGEQKGEPVTFAEFLAEKANEYLHERVNHKGEPVGKNSYERMVQSRLTHMLDKQLSHHIKTEMKDAMKSVVSAVAPAIATTCGLKIREATEDIRRAMGK